ncbi:hypothetical protein KOR42_14330 [Thalassoglobus neptunius]|uniref:Uncharacterized protein n=1 Tax=Thalassoglobus neptunius TaxID=1938619 RepID=A0A5C5X726_9PLAN|nr:hypothetical protein KOR42_14330 [Thalassoglobus neptunius]
MTDIAHRSRCQARVCPLSNLIPWGTFTPYFDVIRQELTSYNPVSDIRKYYLHPTQFSVAD